jgi:hypothetical protein
MTIWIGDEALAEGLRPAGYAALIHAHGLRVPLPERLLAIGERHTYREEGRWRILTPRYNPEPDFAGQLDFAFRHEGVDLAILAALFRVTGPVPVEDWVRRQPTGQHARRAWFLYEWITGTQAALPDAEQGGYVDILDPVDYHAPKGRTIRRHRVRDNLPGTPDFCPLVRRTPVLEELLRGGLAEEARAIVQRTAADLIARAAAFLLLADSRASYVIEGERPPQDRVQRWGQAIGDAGRTPLTEELLLRLQRLVIGEARFTRLGWRREGGFVGARDREINVPFPEHISARPEDLPRLIEGLIRFADRAEHSELDPIAAAASLAFGFVFVHPFEDGNGRVHRWLVHHMLARRGFNPPGVIFPISAVFLERVQDYRTVLERYSQPRLALTDWRVTPALNVEVTNDTLDHFRFFDATAQTEFLARCVVETVRGTLPREIAYLGRHDLAKTRITAFVEMPDDRFDLMIGFLRQGGGRFSARAREREFAGLSDAEAAEIEAIYAELLADG